MVSNPSAWRAPLLLSLLLTSAGCANVTISPQGQPHIATAPTFEERRDFFLWGLIGEHTVDVSAVCRGTAPLQLQTQMTTTDALLTIITLGIYAPRTARIWCS
jgi:hypothetical protein